MATPEETLNIPTPENVSFDYDVAGIGSRFIAALVDTLLIVLLLVLVTLLMSLALGTFLGEMSDQITGYWVLAIVGLVTFAIFWGYYIFFEMLWNGQTPGKRWVNLRVVRIDGMPITLAESLIRNLVRLIDFIPMLYGVGVVTMFINGHSRRLGDLAAGTLVVRERTREVTLESLANDYPPRDSAPKPRPSLEGYGELPVERLTEEDLQLAQEFLRRRGELSNQTALAKHILAIFFKRMELDPVDVDDAQVEKLLSDILDYTLNTHPDPP